MRHTSPSNMRLTCKIAGNYRDLIRSALKMSLPGDQGVRVSIFATTPKKSSTAGAHKCRIASCRLLTQLNVHSLFLHISTWMLYRVLTPLLQLYLSTRYLLLTEGSRTLGHFALVPICPLRVRYRRTVLSLCISNTYSLEYLDSGSRPDASGMPSFAGLDFNNGDHLGT